MAKRIVLTVTNDLVFDQRMQRICTSLAAAGYKITLVGRQLTSSPPIQPQPFKQKRIRLLFNTGFLFYAEYNLRLFIMLLFARAEAFCAIDLDTIIPVYYASVLKGKKRVYDAHELFPEQKEIVTRPFIHRFWLGVEKKYVPKFRLGYTVNDFIVDELHRRYSVNYKVVRNLPVLSPAPLAPAGDKIVIYQGAVNEGRSFETLIPAMRAVNAKLIVCGNGNFFQQAQSLVSKFNVESKVELKGYVLPSELRQLTPQARVAVTLFEPTGLNQYYSLSNRFFDYIMACVPQLCVNYPEYKSINEQYGVALMIDDTKEATIASALNRLLTDEILYKELRNNCVKARQQLNWQREEQVLIGYWNKIFSGE